MKIYLFKQEDQDGPVSLTWFSDKFESIGNDSIWVLKYKQLCLSESLTVVLRIADDKCDSFHYCPHAFVPDMTNFINRCKFRTNKWRVVYPWKTVCYWPFGSSEEVQYWFSRRQTSWIFNQNKEKKKQKNRFSKCSHLVLPIGTILAIFDLQVTLLLPTKFQVY